MDRTHSMGGAPAPIIMARKAVHSAATCAVWLAKR